MLFLEIVLLKQFLLHSRRNESTNLKIEILFHFQAMSGRRETNKGYTQLAVRVEPADDAYADDTTDLMT